MRSFCFICIHEFEKTPHGGMTPVAQRDRRGRAGGELDCPAGAVIGGPTQCRVQQTSRSSGTWGGLFRLGVAAWEEWLYTVSGLWSDLHSGMELD